MLTVFNHNASGHKSDPFTRGRAHMCEVNCMCVRLIVGRPEIFEKKKKDKQYYKRRKSIQLMLAMKIQMIQPELA